MILENGVVRTLDPALPVVRALAIAGETIVGGVGTHETALASPEVVDLCGRTVVPGFSDAHVHFPTWALAQQQINLDGCRSLDEALARVRDAPAPAAGRWIRAYGWRSGDWSPSVEPTRRDLDACTGTVPAALISRDYHSLWLNSSALALANGDLEVTGGVVECDERGEPSGVLREEAAWSFRARYLTVSDDEYAAAMRAGIRLALARGVTAVHDMDGLLGAPRLWQRLREERSLGIRVWQSLPHDRIGPLDAVGVRSGIGDDFLRIGYLKVFMDGTLGSQTALMLDGSGVELTSGEELADIIRRAACSGWPVSVHAIGDRANRNALDAFEQTAPEWRPRGLRHRIEHAQCLAPEDIGRFGAIGVAASVQFSHAPSDRDLAERFWPHRLEGAYASRALLDSGAVVANGSDAPIEELDPLAGIRAGVLRTADERPGWRPEQAVTVEEALVATCVAPAWLTGEERRRGKLLPGYLADLVVLDRDPVACPPHGLAEVQVVATMVGGRWAYNPPPWD
jgi:predicted amidohydrolase YtcJ